jgi:hypothetical protein
LQKLEAIVQVPVLYQTQSESEVFLGTAENQGLGPLPGLGLRHWVRKDWDRKVSWVVVS